MAHAPSIIMFAGEDNYTLASFIDEAESQGVSKRIPVTSIPQGLVPAVSKIFIAHPKAIIQVGAEAYTLEDLAYRLLEMGYLTGQQWANLVEIDMPKGAWQKVHLQPFDPVPACMLDIAYAFSLASAAEQRELTGEFSLTFDPGVVGFSHLTALEYVLPMGVDQLPDNTNPELAQAIDSGYVTPVHVIYPDDDDEDEVDADQ